ncbi:MAG: hypothetical protein IGR92_03580 [Leptolyngbyaceae cyanobacterium T60_A2020_046]|nr:hypothetical protein [Leptolyngbyaceae cyanobacterium T60_A2020_046]
MIRYLVSAIVAAMAVMFLHSMGSSQGLVGQAERGARSVSANPAAASNLTPLEQAGQNVQRQSSATSDPTQVAPTDTDTSTDTADEAQSTQGNQNQQPPADPTPAAPATPQAPIPALW